MAQTRFISVDVFSLKGADWPSLSISRCKELLTATDRLPFEGFSPNRFGLTQVRAIGGTVVYGALNQEHPDLLVVYDDLKHKLEDPRTNSVDLLFVLLLDRGILLFQDHRFVGQGGLNMPQSVERIGGLLSTVFAQCNLPGITLERVSEVTVEKSEFLRLLRTQRVGQLDVKQLAHRDLPPDFKTFNPQFEKNQLFREVWREFEKDNLSTVRLTAPRSGNLGKSKIATVVSNAGTPQRMVYSEPGWAGTRTLRRRVTTHLGKIEVHDPIEDAGIVHIVHVFEQRIAGTRLARTSQETDRQLPLGSQEDGAHLP